MTAEELVPCTSPPPPPSTDPPEHIQDTSTTLDTEMTCPLTSHDDNSIKSNSPGPTDVEMSGFPPNQGRGGTYYNRPQGRSATFSGGIPRPEYGFTATGYNGPMMDTQYYAGQYDTHAPGIGGRPRGNSMAMAVSENSVPLSNISPGPVWPTDNQLNVAYGYGIRRDDGTYTRLVRADQITDYVSRGMPQSQGPEGLIILPQPRQSEPSQRHGDSMIPREVVASLPYNTPSRPSFGAPHDQTQLHIDRIVSRASQPNSPTSPISSGFMSGTPARREKVYCDKWIHDGTCAFTQMGCRYKHEMPMDRPTQMSLGLNHGLPNWYRRTYGINVSPEPISSSPAIGSPPSRSLDGSWRRQAIEAGPSSPTPIARPQVGNSRSNVGSNSGYNGNGNGSGSGRSSSAGRSSNARFGPVGSPPPRSSFNPYKIEEGNEDEEDEITYRGRLR